MFTSRNRNTLINCKKTTQSYIIKKKEEKSDVFRRNIFIALTHYIQISIIENT